VAWAILDTGVYIDHWQGRLPDDALAKVRAGYVVRHSAVVLSELRRGARTGDARALVESLHVLAKVCWEPTAADWWQAGDLVRRIGDEQDWEPTKRREFQNDVLIGLTAKRHGAAIVTTNGRDFALLADAIRIRVVSLRSV
jgi:predicted nucleic acid-binding protein